MCKVCWASVFVLLLVVAGMGYKFIVSGEVEPAADGRETLLLEPGERDMVLAEMRTFLESVQAITQGIGENDMTPVVEAARRVGSAAQQGVPGSLVRKLPLPFKKLGFDTHRQFEQLALDAEQLGDGEYTLKQLGVLLQNCVACHASYRFDAGGAEKR